MLPSLLTELECNFNLQHVQSRMLDDNGISVHCFKTKRMNWCKRISSIDITALLQFTQQQNELITNGNITYISTCTLILTTDTNHKIFCFMIDVNKWHIHNMSRKIFSRSSAKTKQDEKNGNVYSINDVIENSVPDYFVKVEREEEYFDKKFATFFLRLVFEKTEITDRVIIDLNEIVLRIRENLDVLHLKLSRLYLYDTDGPWNEMRLCMQVEKTSLPVNPKSGFLSCNEASYNQQPSCSNSGIDSIHNEGEDDRKHLCEISQKSRFNMSCILFTIPIVFLVTFAFSNFATEGVSRFFF